MGSYWARHVGPTFAVDTMRPILVVQRYWPRDQTENSYECITAEGHDSLWIRASWSDSAAKSSVIDKKRIKRTGIKIPSDPVSAFILHTKFTVLVLVYPRVYP